MVYLVIDLYLRSCDSGGLPRQPPLHHNNIAISSLVVPPTTTNTPKGRIKKVIVPSGCRKTGRSNGPQQWGRCQEPRRPAGYSLEDTA